MYRAVVFFDLDGTLLDSNKKVQSSSLSGLNQLSNNHILPVISTGRNLLMIETIMKRTGIQTVICANGSYIQYQGKPLNTIVIPTSTLRKLIKISNQNENALAFQTRDQIVLNQSNSLTKAAYLHHSVNPSVNPRFYQDHPVNFVNLFTTDHDRFYINKFRGELNVVRNSAKCLDVMKAGVNKQLGIQILLKKLELTKVPTYAFGDGLNDIEMFNQVDHPIAMGNGLKPCKAHGEFITTTNDRDGIYNGLVHYHLI